MKKPKGKKKTDDLRVFESTYLAAIIHNSGLTRTQYALPNEPEQLRLN